MPGISPEQRIERRCQELFFRDDRLAAFFLPPFFAELFLADVFFAEDFLAPFFADFFLGAFAPSLRASESPIAMACFFEVTFFPEPLFNVPRLRSCMAFST